MSRLPLAVNRAISMFSQVITARDSEFKYQDHEFKEVDGDQYQFRGFIAPAQDNELQMLPEGQVTEAMYVVHVIGRKLYVRDQISSDPSPNNAYSNQNQEREIQNKQTFVYHHGEELRVLKEMNRTPDGRFNRYYAAKTLRGRS